MQSTPVPVHAIPKAALLPALHGISTSSDGPSAFVPLAACRRHPPNSPADAGEDAGLDFDRPFPGQTRSAPKPRSADLLCQRRSTRTPELVPVSREHLSHPLRTSSLRLSAASRRFSILAAWC